MKVLIVNRYMGIYGGAETVVKELAGRLNNLGIKNLILTLNISEEVKNICTGLDIVTPEKNFPYKFRSTDLLSSLGIFGEIKHLRQLVKKHAAGYDLINVHNFPANWVAAGLGKPVAWMCNEVPDFYNSPRPSLSINLLRAAGIGVDRAIVNRSIDTICVADEFNAQKVIRRYGRIPEIVPYGIEYDFFADTGAQDFEIIRKNILENSFLLLQVGMLSPEKNQLKSIQAVEQLKSEIPNIALLLAGKGGNPYEEMLKEYIRRQKLQKYIIFTGHLSKAQIRALYYGCKIALFPVKTQGGWLAPFEALCAGKPIITSSSMGAASIVKKENLGIVSDDLVKAIKDINHNYDFYAKIAQRAKGWVKDNLSWNLFTEKMLGVFEKTLSDWRRR